MSYIFGIYNRDRSALNPEETKLMEEAFKDGVVDAHDTWQRDYLSLGNTLIFNTPESLNEKLPFFHQESELCITADARIDNREELIHLLNIKKQGTPDSQLILMAYQKWNTNCVNYLKGDFAFAIWDQKEHRLFIARDIIGIKGVYYSQKKNKFLFASSLNGILAAKNNEPKFNEAWLPYFITNVPPKEGLTVYQDVFQLEPAYFLVVNESGFRKVKYFEFDPDKETRFKDEREYEEGFREKMIHAVETRTRSAYPVGAELSGGLDSSSITCIADDFLRKKGERITTFSNVMREEDQGKIRPFKDEREYINEILNFKKIENAHFINNTDDNYLKLMNEHLDRYAAPPDFTGMHGIASKYLYQKASKKNIRTILSGVGGDEVVTSQTLQHLKELLFGFKFFKYFNSTWNLYKSENKKETFLKVLHKAKKDLLSKREVVGILQKKESRFAPFLNTEYATNKAFTTERPELPFYKNTYSVSKSQLKVLNYGYMPIRTETTGLFSAKYGIDFRYPLLDVSLISYYLSLPVNQKINRGWGRLIFRKSMEGILPETIQWRNNKTGNITPAFVRIILDSEEEMKKKVIEMREDSFVRKYYDLNLLVEQINNVNFDDWKEALSTWRAVEKCIWLYKWKERNF